MRYETKNLRKTTVPRLLELELVLKVMYMTGVTVIVTSLSQNAVMMDFDNMPLDCIYYR